MFAGVHGAAEPDSQTGALERPLERVADPVLEKLVLPELCVAVMVSPVAGVQSPEDASQKSRSARIESARLEASRATSERTLEVPVLDVRSAPSLAHPSRPTLMTMRATITSTRLKPRA
jgi:hypothetical protein